MSNNKVNLTSTNIKNFSIPDSGKRTYYYDTKTPGLGVMVFPSGTKTFFLYKRVDGKPDKIKLGRFPDMHPEKAREAAYKLMSQISDGINPNKKKQKLRAEMMFADLFERYMDEYAKVRKKSWKTDQGYYERYLKCLDNKKISSIHKADIEKLHNKIKETKGLYAANRVIALTSTIYNKAIDWGFDGINPAAKIEKFTEKSRDRVLQKSEMEAFFESLSNEQNEVLKNYFLISLFTGARRSNVQAMRWDQIIYCEKTMWNIPDTKNGESQNVALVPQALEILKILRELHDSEWVFPSVTSKSGHIEEPKSAWKRIITRAGIKDLRIHDLRRTLASYQVKVGANSFVIQKTLGHKQQQATAVYARVTSDVTQEYMEKAVNEMFNFNKK